MSQEGARGRPIVPPMGLSRGSAGALYQPNDAGHLGEEAGSAGALALPDNCELPPECPKPPVVRSVTTAVPIDLRNPVVLAGLWFVPVLAGVAVPEAPAHLNCGSMPWQDDVWSSREPAIVQRETVPEPVCSSSDLI